MSQVILKHEGKFEAGVASSQFVVVQCAPNSKLLGTKGRFESGEAGQAAYQLL